MAQTVKNLPVMQEIWVQSLGREDPLEKEMESHSSILAWEIPWTEEPGGLQSIGSQSVRHNSVTKQQQQHIYYNDQNPGHGQHQQLGGRGAGLSLMH